MGLGIVDELKKEYDIEDTWLGLEIHPETPLEGINLNDKFGEINLKKMKDNLEHSGSKYNITFGHLNHMPNSHNSLEAAEYARSIGKFDEYHRGLMSAYFRDSKNIGDINVLKGIGSKIGLESKKLHKAIEERKFVNNLNEYSQLAHSMNINSTPTFIINNEHIIVGAQPIDVFKKLFDKIMVG
ncbi:DsbA family protein [Clostridium sp. D2Q-11]|uniref:DsbA family protein n=1 Tax=Anaeromonas frigoriresistens TaxID=2683708 RepID=A0A942UVU0_9FIRM|nr:DsbA family protein [Anaeromonas frigoriresistens]